jgi:UDP-2,3-diacylglucosamine pyrophosphatase LpxH
MYIFLLAMQVILRIIFLVAIPFLCALGQTKIAFVSDTQAPMWIEDVFLKSNKNEKATALLFSEIVNQKPSDLFILGDVVTLGYKEKKWKKMDSYLQSCRDAGIAVSALLGNHDVMSNSKKGEEVFQLRFPNHVRTGFVKITDSVAVVLLNSNFKKLSGDDMTIQQSWLKSTLKNLDGDPAIQVVIVSCHHAPYSNSKIVGSSEGAQNYFIPLFFQSTKSKLFITGHSHAFEHFKKEGKDFLVIGGGGGIHQPLKSSNPSLKDLTSEYKPMFHYLTATRKGKSLQLVSHFLKNDFSGFDAGHSINVPNELK